MSQSVWANFPGQGYGTVTQADPVWVGPKRVREALDYTIDITDDVDPDADVIIGAVGQVAPSGTGELVLSQITVVGFLVTVFLSGGQPGRTYTIPLTISMANNRVFEFIRTVSITPDLITDQPQPVPSAGYGPVVNAILSPAPSPGFASGVGAAHGVGMSTVVAVGSASGTGAASGHGGP